MSSVMDIPPDERRGRFGLWGVLAALGLLVAGAVGVVAVFVFAKEEYRHDLRSWQTRLDIVADGRKAAIEDWLSRQTGGIGAIAENDSVRLFLTQFKSGGGDLGRIADGEGQKEYLENLLTITADRGGFKAPPFGPSVPADVGQVGLAGIAIYDSNNRPVARTRGAPVDGAIGAFLANAQKARPALRDVFLDPAGKAAMGFLAPIFSVQGDPIPDQQVGWVLGIKEIGAELYPLLRQPGAEEATAEGILVRRAGPAIDFLSPLRDGKGPLSFELAIDTPQLAAADALKAPGGFGILRDYRDVEVLFTSRAIAGTPWVLVYKVNRREALADTDMRVGRLVVILVLVILLVAIATVAVWRNIASRHASLAAERYQKLAARFESMHNLLCLVTDNQPEAVFICGEDERYRFANRAAAAAAGIDAKDMIGKRLDAVLGPAAARRCIERNRRALESREPLVETYRTGDGAASRVIESQHIPLEATAGIDGGVLVIEQNVTALVSEHERREQNLRRLTGVLASLIDRRDPFAAQHSIRVGKVARAIAEDMQLSPPLIEAAATASTLMNLGKILVPRPILTRPGPLSDVELDKVRSSLLEAVNFLEAIEFDDPVIETLRQCREHWDGSGQPRGLKGAEILPTARILAVADAFVAMVSPRSHRPAIGVDAALDIMLDDAGKRFDRAVVAALVHRLENLGGREAWADFLAPAQAP